MQRVTTAAKEECLVLTSLSKLAKAITEHLSIDELANHTLALLANDMDMRNATLTIRNRKTGEIFIEQAVGLSDEERERGRYAEGEGITGRVVETGRPIIVPDVSQEPLFLDRTGTHRGEGGAPLAFICVPIVIEQSVVGTVSAACFHNPERDLEADRDVLSIIAAIIAQAVRLHQAQHEERVMLEDENRRLHNQLRKRFRPSNIIGNAKTMRYVFALMEKVVTTNATVLLLGESGVGKGLVAHAIHYNSARSQGPFITFNCAALPADLVEAELFGHEKGAFTGAQSARVGKFEAAKGGTIFLDEIGEMSLSIQAKFLRILQDKEFERLGGNVTLKTDVRIIAATNKHLEDLIKESRFREDLYYRLNVFPITVPPLRERKTDIPLLVDYFVEEFCKENGKHVLRVSTPAIDMLMSYHWPGNVRELENAIERAVILSDDGVIHAYHLPPTLQTASSSHTHVKGSLQKILANVEYEIIVEALKESKGNVREAARELGLTERILGLRLKKYDIDFRSFREYTNSKA